MTKRTRKRLGRQAIKAAEKRLRRREQYRQASARKREKKRAARQALVPAVPDNQKIFAGLSKGDFPADMHPVEAMAKLGLTNKEIADVMGVSSVTFKKWQRISPRLKAAVRRGRVVADTHVANSMYNQAIGYHTVEQKTFYDTKRGKVVKTKVNRYHPPNTVAGIFWLKNRFRDYWSDTKRIENENGPQVVNDVKFVLVSADTKRGSERVIDGDYKILEDSGPKNPTSLMSSETS